MKTKLTYFTLLFLSLFTPFKALLDGSDNTITVNGALYRALIRLGIQRRNHIYIFKLASAPAASARVPAASAPGSSTPVPAASAAGPSPARVPAASPAGPSSSRPVPADTSAGLTSPSGSPLYAFTILPTSMNAAATITRQLLYNTHYRCFGFEAACPTIQSMFYNWGVNDLDRCLRARIHPCITADNQIFFVIHPDLK